MPKITEGTVAEHRRVQHEQVLRAARQLMAEQGAVPSVGQVAQRVGLARTSVYQYIRSRTDLVAQLMVQSLEEWADAVQAAMDGSDGSPRARLMAYVCSNLDLLADWSTNSLLAASAREPGVMSTPEVARAHARLQPALVQALVDAGLPHPEALPYAEFLDVSIHHGADMVVRGHDRRVVLTALERMVDLAAREG